MGVSRWLAGRILEGSVAKTPLSVPDPLYLALLEAPAAPVDTGVSLAPKEASYVGYQRVAVPASRWGVPEVDVMRNVAQIDGPTLTSGIGRVSWWALCTQAAGGQIAWFGAMTAIIITTADPTPVFPPGIFVLSLASVI